MNVDYATASYHIPPDAIRNALLSLNQAYEIYAAPQAGIDFLQQRSNTQRSCSDESGHQHVAAHRGCCGTASR
jgi:hypothetical protein